MLNFNLHTGQRLYFGKDIENRSIPASERAGSTPHFSALRRLERPCLGLLDRVEKTCFAAGLAFVELGGVSLEPEGIACPQGHLHTSRRGHRLCTCDGGGSVIDSAKAIAMGVATTN